MTLVATKNNIAIMAKHTHCSLLGVIRMLIVGDDAGGGRETVGS